MMHYYDRFKSDVFDYTTCHTCAALLHWMEKRVEFDQVHFEPGKGCGNLEEKWGKDRVEKLIQESKLESKRMRHKKYTIDRCWKLMLRDLWIEDQK